jgi:hypothetical protein
MENIFSRTSRPISIKLDKNHPCIKGIQVLFKGGIIAKIGWGNLKIFS